MIDSLLVANRGEIARRVIRTARRLGVRTIAVHSDVDAGLPFVREADESVLLGPAAPNESYLDPSRVLRAARDTGAEAVHPGYGFLSESPSFARAVIDSGLVWVGPSPDSMTAMADKVSARSLMAAAGVPVLPGTADPVHDEAGALAAAARIGYPVMVKAAAGGGGIGMSRADDDDTLRAAFATARSRAERFFADPAVLLERFVPHARHIEVQVLGLADGTVLTLGERDCSVQRRHQKVVEESPSPGVDDALRAHLVQLAGTAARAVDYRNAGTVEMLLDVESREVYFLEMNTRLQVEHPVTEMVTGIDIVEQQLRIAAGDEVTVPVPVVTRGHAIELRVYAEDPVRFLPGPGTITHWREPAGAGVRVDAGYAQGDVVTPSYDPLLAKLVVHGADRPEALARARAAVAAFEVVGPRVNLPFFDDLLADEHFVRGDYDTGIVARLRPAR